MNNADQAVTNSTLMLFHRNERGSASDAVSSSLYTSMVVTSLITKNITPPFFTTTHRDVMLPGNGLAGDVDFDDKIFKHVLFLY